LPRHQLLLAFRLFDIQTFAARPDRHAESSQSAQIAAFQGSELAHCDVGPVAHGVEFGACLADRGQSRHLLRDARFGQRELRAAPLESPFEIESKAFHGFVFLAGRLAAGAG
jgi:hypothetical protein